MRPEPTTARTASYHLRADDRAARRRCRATRTPCSGCFAMASSRRTGGSRRSRSAPSDEYAVLLKTLLDMDGFPWKLDQRRDHLVGGAAGAVRPAAVLQAPLRRARAGGRRRASRPACRSCTRTRARSAPTGSSTRWPRTTSDAQDAAASSSTSAPRRPGTWSRPKGEYLGGVIAPGITDQRRGAVRARGEAAARRAGAPRQGRRAQHGRVDAGRPGLRLRRHGRRAGRADPRRGRLPGALHRDRRARAADRDRDPDDRGDRRAARPSRASRSCINATR